MRTKANDNQKRGRKEDTLPKLLDLENIGKRLCEFAHSGLFRLRLHSLAEHSRLPTSRFNLRNGRLAERVG